MRWGATGGPFLGSLVLVSAAADLSGGHTIKMTAVTIARSASTMTTSSQLFHHAAVQTDEPAIRAGTRGDSTGAMPSSCARCMIVPVLTKPAAAYGFEWPLAWPF